MYSYTYINKLQQVSVPIETYKEKVTKNPSLFFFSFYQEVINMRRKKNTELRAP